MDAHLPLYLQNVLADFLPEENFIHLTTEQAVDWLTEKRERYAWLTAPNLGYRNPAKEKAARLMIPNWHRLEEWVHYLESQWLQPAKRWPQPAQRTDDLLNRRVAGLFSSPYESLMNEIVTFGLLTEVPGGDGHEFRGRKTNRPPTIIHGIRDVLGPMTDVYVSPGVFRERTDDEQEAVWQKNMDRTAASRRRQAFENADRTATW